MPGPTTDDGDRPPPGPLQPQQPEDGYEVAGMERIGARIEADVARDGSARGESIGQTGGGGVQDAAPFELLEEARAAPL